MAKARIAVWTALALASALTGLFAFRGGARRTPPAPAAAVPRRISEGQSVKPASPAPAPRPRKAAAAPPAPPRQERGAGLRDEGEAFGGRPPDRTVP